MRHTDHVQSRAAAVLTAPFCGARQASPYSLTCMKSSAQPMYSSAVEYFTDN